MFYVKSEITEGVTIQSEITDNVFTVCPVCGTEHRVDLDCILKCEHTDLYSTNVYCEECTKRREQERMQAERRGFNLDHWVPSEADKPALMVYFNDRVKRIKESCGDDWEAKEALELYRLVKHNPLRYTKDAIQEHFAEMFHCVDGEIEKYYADCPEIIRLINLTICPDPLKEE